jgi:hypothetical protein
MTMKLNEAQLIKIIRKAIMSEVISGDESRTFVGEYRGEGSVALETALERNLRRLVF